MSAQALAEAAAALVGSRFRLHGRDPATGLDCIGVLAAALAAIGRPVSLPTGYALRARAPPPFDRWAQACGLVASPEPLASGDVLIVAPAPCQHHLLVAACAGGFIHAHAGLRRVVRMPGPIAWPVLRRWRLT